MEGKFNIYCNDVDLESLYNLCLNNGELHTYGKGDVFSMKDKRCRYVGIVKSGYLKYVLSDSDGEEHITGFSFQNTLVGDYFSITKRAPSMTSIVAAVETTVIQCKVEILEDYLENNPHVFLQLSNALFYQVYTQYLNMHRMTPRERYLLLLKQCPDLLQTISLKEIASYLQITPTHLSRLRKEITFG